MSNNFFVPQRRAFKGDAPRVAMRGARIGEGRLKVSTTMELEPVTVREGIAGGGIF